MLNADASLDNEISVCSTDDESDDSTDSEGEEMERPTRSLPMDVHIPGVSSIINLSVVHAMWYTPRGTHHVVHATWCVPHGVYHMVHAMWYICHII